MLFDTMEDQEIEKIMTPEEQRITIARACGWKSSPIDAQHFTTAWEKDGHLCFQVPNYLNDLNACHEAEKTLNHSQQWDYMQSLRLIRELGDGGWTECHAPAAQRCEAFLRVMNLWKEDAP